MVQGLRRLLGDEICVVDHKHGGPTIFGLELFRQSREILVDPLERCGRAIVQVLIGLVS